MTMLRSVLILTTVLGLSAQTAFCSTEKWSCKDEKDHFFEATLDSTQGRGTVGSFHTFDKVSVTLTSEDTFNGAISGWDSIDAKVLLIRNKRNSNRGHVFVTAVESIDCRGDSDYSFVLDCSITQ